MNPILFYEYGKSRSLPPNTFIGGVSATITTRQLLATKLGISLSRVTSFAIDVNDIECNISGGTYGIPLNCFNGNAITFYDDQDGLVTSIGGRGFYNCASLTSIKLDSVLTIANSAFYGCTAITSYVFPSVTSIESIGNTVDGTFNANQNLITFNAPNLTEITGNASSRLFYNCANLVSFIAPQLGGTIQRWSFLGCTSLSTFTAGNITSVIGEAFSNCSSLESFEYDSVTSIGAIAFTGCSKLKIIRCNGVTGTLLNIFSPTALNIEQASFNSVTTIQGTFINQTKMFSFSAPLTTAIKVGSFRNCLAMTSFNFPEVTTIDDSAFLDCRFVQGYDFPKLTTINTVSNTNNGTFNRNYAMTSFNAPALLDILGTGRCFFDSISLVSFYAPLLRTLGNAGTSSNNFTNIKLNATITVSIALETINAGSPDGDLVYAKNTRAATIIYI